MHLRHALGALVLVSLLVPSRAATASAGPRQGVLPPRNPAGNIAAVPDFSARCAPNAFDDSSRCTAAALAAIDRARRLEHLAPLRLPLGRFRALSPAAQLFALANLERVTRGLPPFRALVRSLDRAALVAARAGVVPTVTGSRPRIGPHPIVTWAGNWAGGTYDALASDYEWMYADGPGGVNLDCKVVGGPACWGHRDNILGRFPAPPGACGARRPVVLVMGAAAAPARGAPSFAELFVALCAPRAPGTVLTWAFLEHTLHLTRAELR